MEMSSKSLNFADESYSRMFESSAVTVVAKPVITDKRLIYRIIENGVDVTPDNMTDPEYVMMDDKDVHAAFDSKQRVRSVVKISKSKSEAMDLGMKVYATTINLDDIHIDHTLNTEEGFEPDTGDLDIAPSAFAFPKLIPTMVYPPSIMITLKETETEFLFEFPSASVDRSAPESTTIDLDNEYYAYITVGKGRNRRMITEETQTQSCITQSRHTMATRPKKKNSSAFASLWDMHDTYAKLAQQKVEEEPDEMVMYQSAAPHLLRKKKPKESPDAKVCDEVADLVATPQFKDAVLLTERVLAASKYDVQQKRFRGLYPMNPFSLDLVYIYTLTPLWTLECEETVGRPITSVSFNPKNNDILAASYGKFVYANNIDGLVCVWCTKNPCKPERTYQFEVSVSCLKFSITNPNWLACGFDNGDVIILDIISYTILTTARSKRETNPCFETIWCIFWCYDETLESEYVMTACQDGRINRFVRTKTNDFMCSPMMRVTCVEGNMKGLAITRGCVRADVPVTRFPAALSLVWHPTVRHLYYVGTDEGCVHKCSTNYLNQHMDVFRAHAGPVYGIVLSPFMQGLMLTCGADGAIRMWLEGIDEVIMTMPCAGAVYGVAFCPVNSTLLVSISKNVVGVWDLRRKTHMPCAEYTFPGTVVLTYVSFSLSGENVFVADTLGRIHTFHLEDTPIPPFYQHKLLDEAIKKALCTRPQLLKQLQKLKTFSRTT